MTAPDLEQLEAAYEEAWLAYNVLQRDLPDCEHVRAWQAEITAARKKHQAALRDFDRAAAGTGITEEQPEPVSPSLPIDTGPEQEPLFDLDAA